MASARYWRNRGDGRFDPPRTLAAVPAGVALGSPGVQICDIDGDGRPDLLVSTPPQTGYWPLQPPADGADGRPPGSTPPATWPRASAPTVSLSDPSVRMLDLDGDGEMDVAARRPASDRLSTTTAAAASRTCRLLEPPDGLGETSTSPTRG